MAKGVCINSEAKDLVVAIVKDSPEQILKEIEKIPVCKIKQRGKRKPSAYNEFMGSCLKGKSKDKPHKENFKICVNEWKAKKK